MQTKICGITIQKDIEIINKYKPTYAGFVFFEKSKRNVSLEQAKELLVNLDSGITPVAVCVSPEIELMKQLSNLGFHQIQIHGNLSEEMIQVWPGNIWQAVNMDGDQIPNVISHNKITGYVVDGAKYGGGETFAWDNESIVHAFKSLKRADELLILAGGLTPENVKQGIAIFSPDVCDVSSGVEGAVGKDEMKVHDFIVNAANAEE